MENVMEIEFDWTGEGRDWKIDPTSSKKKIKIHKQSYQKKR